MRRVLLTAALAAGLVAALPAPAGQVIDDIVAWVNGDIITLSQYEIEEEAMIGEAYRKLSGEQLDQRIADIRTSLLQQIIDRKILVHHAQGLGYDVEKMKGSMLQDFMKQQGVASEAELEQLLAAEGSTIAALEDRLLEMSVPTEVVRFEVAKRLAVGDQEIERYYREHPDEFVVESKATFREIVLLDDEQAESAEIREKADQIVSQAQAGTDFAELARQHSQAGTATGGGLIGPVNPADVSQTLRDVVFTLPIGEVSEPIETDYGLHLVFVEERSERRALGLDEVREKLRTYLEDVKYRQQLQEFLARAREESEWCVKPRYHELLSSPVPTDCDNL